MPHNLYFRILIAAVLPHSLAVQLWPYPGALSDSIPARCRVALVSDITCSQFVSSSFVGAGFKFTEAFVENLCTPACSNSLSDLQTSVSEGCGSTIYEFEPGYNTSGNAIVDPLVWAYEVVCLRSNSNFCYPSVSNGTSAPCSNCTLLYDAALLQSPYGLQRMSPPVFSSILSSCSSPASNYPYTTATLPSQTQTTAPTPTCIGTNYTVSTADTCESIAKDHSVATNIFITDNRLDYNCTTLPVGSTVCIPPSCELLTITSANETCAQILEGQTFYLTQFLSWNPTIHSNCDNLGSMIGRTVCISPPGSSGWEVGNSSTMSSNTVSYVIPPTGFTPVPTTYTATSYNTSYFVPTTTIPVPTITVVLNTTAESIYKAYATYCPYNSTWYNQGVFPGDAPGNCSELLEPYCFPDIDQPSPTPTVFPSSCLPQNV